MFWYGVTHDISHPIAILSIEAIYIFIKDIFSINPCYNGGRVHFITTTYDKTSTELLFNICEDSYILIWNKRSIRGICRPQ